MCLIFLISLACYIVTVSVQAQENVIQNSILENKALLENEVALDDELIVKDYVNVENKTILKNETNSETILSEMKIISENATIFETKPNLENSTIFEKKINLENETNLKNKEILKNEESLKNEKLLNNNSKLIGRIVNGTEAYLGQFPQQVSLRRTGSQNHFCGGSIVNLKYILTAAHCMFIGQHMEIQIPPTSITIVAGNILLEGASVTRQERIVKKITIHRKFDKDTLENDIALLQLEKPLVENKAIQVAKLPNSTITPGTFCDVSGWGFLKEDVKEVSNVLMFVKLPLLTQKKCRELLVNISLVPNGMLCAGYEKGEKDACQGDSGGGMLCNNKLTGVVSGGIGCAMPKIPGVYTDVYFYKKWIKTVILTEEFTNNLRRSNSSSTIFVNLFWLVATLFSAFLLSMYC